MGRPWADEVIVSTRCNALLVDRGDLPSLAALFMQPDPSRVALWHLRERGAAADARLAAAAEHARIVGAELTSPGVPEDWSEDADPGRGGPAAAEMLLRAARAALRLGAARVIWPVQVAGDAAEMARAVDTASGASELLDLAAADRGHPRRGDAPVAGSGSVFIDLPLVDLADDQVVDLADDAGAPLVAFWPCGSGGTRPCERCDECIRWRRALADQGLPWPWAAERVAAGRI